MKKCPYSAEQIKDEVLKCKHCGEMLNKNPQEKWYCKIWFLIFAFLCIGPFALPLFWFNPRFNKRNKVIISVIVIILSYYLGVMFIKSLRSIDAYYQMLFQ